jgi:hypothetical protein
MGLTPDQLKKTIQAWATWFVSEIYLLAEANHHPLAYQSTKLKI